jgi:protein-S-isoprenylcysteine O-methyltransferase Ste14
MSKQGQPDNPGVIMLPPYIFLIAIGAILALEFLLPFNLMPPASVTNPLMWVGLLAFVAGLRLAYWGRATFIRAGTNVPPSKPALLLVTDGPYRYSRNPMYVGMLLVVAGLTIGLSLEWGLIVWPLFLAVLHFGVILREERYMTAKFGAPYEEFRGRTRRYF